MRLSQQTQVVIRDTVREVFGSDAEVLVFGSRIIDSARGGDIDLLVRMPAAVPERQRKIHTVTARLQLRLGDQPIDVLVLDPETKPLPIHEQALKTGIPL